MEKLKVLVNVYACSPGRGSEPGTGWNMCAHLAKHCELFIITEEEFRENIELTLPLLPQGKNMHFYYNPVGEKVRNMSRNQGDWRFYYHYKKWQKRTLEIAKLIINEHNIDIIHQLNMIGFREPGFLWRLNGIPFVWGPIGGIKQFPVAYLQGAQLKVKIFNRLKNTINLLQLKYDPRVNVAFKKADILISSIPYSYKKIKEIKKRESILISETGSVISEDVSTERFYTNEFHIIWAGRFYFRKQLPLALKALAATKNKQIKLNIYGDGDETIIKEAQHLIDSLNITDQVIWHGNQPHAVVQQAMREAQLFLFTSVSEDNPNVVLEAISNRLPIVCFDTCGFGDIIDDSVGRKIPLTNPEQSTTDFAENLNTLNNNRKLLEDMSINCSKLQQQLSWDEKALKIYNLYKSKLHK